jgi:6,7-dimethyl-8-ribityllumazine synthase
VGFGMEIHPTSIIRNMATTHHNLSDYDPDTMEAGTDLTIGIVVSDWNPDVTHALHQGCLETLRKHGVPEEQIRTIQVPGAFELPVGAKLLAGSRRFDAVICLGCVVKGETRHDEYINSAVANGLATLGVVSGLPVIFGLLTTDTLEQATDRAGGRHGNKGVEAAYTALRMARLRRQLSLPGQKIGF